MPLVRKNVPVERFYFFEQLKEVGLDLWSSDQANDAEQLRSKIYGVHPPLFVSLITTFVFREVKSQFTLYGEFIVIEVAFSREGNAILDTDERLSKFIVILPTTPSNMGKFNSVLLFVKP